MSLYMQRAHQHRGAKDPHEGDNPFSKYVFDAIGGAWNVGSYPARRNGIYHLTHGLNCKEATNKTDVAETKVNETGLAKSMEHASNCFYFGAKY